MSNTARPLEALEMELLAVFDCVYGDLTSQEYASAVGRALSLLREAAGPTPEPPAPESLEWRQDPEEGIAEEDSWTVRFWERDQRCSFILEAWGSSPGRSQGHLIAEDPRGMMVRLYETEGEGLPTVQADLERRLGLLRQALGPQEAPSNAD